MVFFVVELGQSGMVPWDVIQRELFVDGLFSHRSSTLRINLQMWAKRCFLEARWPYLGMNWASASSQTTWISHK